MPKQSYGVIPKERSRSLLLALVNFANDELEGDETKIELLRPNLQTHWQSSTRLVVRTKLRHLQTLSSLAHRDQPLTLAQIKTALNHWANFLAILEDNRTMIRGSEQWHFTVTLWRDRWDGEGNQTCFDQTWESRRSGASGIVKPSEPENIQISVPAQSSRSVPLPHWQNLCRAALNTRLTSNPMTAHDGMVFELGDLYVPLGVTKGNLLEEESDHDGDDNYYDPQALIAHYCDLDSSPHPHRIAIVGEPGAGKSTLLQRLALVLLEQTPYLPVWVSLGDLEFQTLESYVTTTWLRQAVKQFTVASETLQELGELIAHQRIWLLLDGLDEMGEQAIRGATSLDRELQGWLGQTHVILTCRSSVWHGGKNALGYYETYRCQGFSQDHWEGTNLIDTFITQWFTVNPDLGDRLKHQLTRRETKPIRELVRHPLYLTLLCRTWQLTQGQLPHTKATLFRQFVEALYEWKQDAFPTTRSQRKNLNQALARLALQGMTQRPPTLRFRGGEIERCFDAIDPDLFTLAIQLGWLEVMGRSGITGEKIYRFYHLTFQEYFAAMALDHGHDLIKIEQGDQTIYPIFEWGWQEIILLWLGREDLAAMEKEAFLKTLSQWQDHCGGFYGVKAWCLVGKGLAEFPGFSGASGIIDQLIQWRFGGSPPDRPALPPAMVEQAGIALSRSDRGLTVPALESFLAHTENPFQRWLLAHSLGKNHDPGNPTAIATLEQLLVHQELDLNFKLNLCRSLGAISPHNPLVLHTLTQILTTETNVSTLRKAALRLGKIHPNHPLAIDTLVNLINHTSDRHQRGNILDTLAQIKPDHPLVASHPAEAPPPAKSNQPKTKSPRQWALAAQTIEQKLAITVTPHKKMQLIGRLATYAPDHPLIVPTLLETLATVRRKGTLKLAIEVMTKLIDQEAIAIVLPQVRDIYLNPKTPAPAVRACYQLLWHWSKELPYPEFQHLWRQDQTEERPTEPRLR